MKINARNIISCRIQIY